MTKGDLVRHVMKEAGLSQAQARRAVDAILKALGQSLVGHFVNTRSGIALDIPALGTIRVVKAESVVAQPVKSLPRRGFPVLLFEPHARLGGPHGGGGGSND